MGERLEFDLVVRQNDLKKSLTDASSSAQKLSGDIGKGVKDAAEEARTATDGLGGSVSNFAQNALSIAAGTLAFNLFSSAVGFVKNSITESIGAYAESEDAINKLGQALRVTGSFSESASEDMQAFASELQATSKFGDEAILNQISFAKSLGATNSQAKNLVLAAANLSATLGGSLEENADKLGKTLSGTTGRLALLIPELKNLTAEQLRNGAAAEIINQKYGGAAANDLNTFTGRVESLKNSFNDLQEFVGKTVVTSTLFQKVISGLKSSIDETNTALAAYNVEVLGMAGAQAIGSKTASQLSSDIKKVDDQIVNVKKNIAESQRLADTYMAIDPVLSAKEEAAVARLNLELNQLVKSRAEIARQKDAGLVAPEGEDKKGATGLTDEQRTAIQNKNAEILSLDKQLQLERANQRQAELNATLAEEDGKNQAELQRMLDFSIKKAEIEAELKRQSIDKNAPEEEKALELKKINKEKELAILTAHNKKVNDLNADMAKKDKAAKNAQIDLEKSYYASKGTLIAQGFTLAATLAKDGSKTQFAITKAAALAEILIADGKARALIPAQTAMIPFPGNLAAAATLNGYVTAQTAMGTAIVAASAIKGFAGGGVIGEMSGATSGGDNRLATVRDGEMVLNANQQKRLFDFINSGMNGGDIVVEIDGREVFRAVREQIKSGMTLA